MSTDLRLGNSATDDECIICFEKLIKNSPDLWQCVQCGVKIHITCVNNFPTQTCPCCRKEFVNPNQAVVTIMPSYNRTIVPNQTNFYIYNNLFRELFYKGSLFIITCLISIIITMIGLFFILPYFVRGEEIYNITNIK